ncbi:protein of unknown function [Candidatus Filomicrobium marinum]|uniref:Uncharacterized protein n=1 Tax=Candidatus Filomicrobium marinum TaxID=1608628 RepID=A0A0D6JFN2_9HYPH|nr:protein of unknown function [Candidatus Filomicrobium marinum]CPR19412.1 protein of unknown function [Candidatus Filomicrobium marinum]
MKSRVLHCNARSIVDARLSALAAAPGLAIDGVIFKCAFGGLHVCRVHCRTGAPIL